MESNWDLAHKAQSKRGKCYFGWLGSMCALKKPKLHVFWFFDAGIWGIF